MIGVIAQSSQLPIAAEFFELFKTPWEPYRRGSAYDVVITTTGEVPHLMPKLFISFGIERDTPGVAGHESVTSVPTVCHGEWRMPIYRGLQTFDAAGRWTEYVCSDAGVAGLRSHAGDCTMLRIGYDLFEEVRSLLSTGQPVEHAGVPTLDLHIELLRRWILDAGVPVVEIAHAPVGHDFAVCLTHDIDYVGIRDHLFDHTMWGFLYRSTVVPLRDLVKRRTSVGRVWRTWRAAASLPFVYLGWAKDFWEPFDWYLDVEEGLPATYYVIPYKRRAGEHVGGPTAARRATAYDVTDIPQSVEKLIARGCEVGVHGLDAWHDVQKGRDELCRVQSVTRTNGRGIRMHWLFQDDATPKVLEQAGFSYDSSSGYNETVGFKNGTTQVFKPIAAPTLLELPMHIQDGALFYPQRLHLSEREADARCDEIIQHARTGGVLTVIWHDRSHAAERFWGEFYRALVQRLRAMNAWFATGSQVTDWFRARRSVQFTRVRETSGTRVAIRYEGAGEVEPQFRVRISRPASAAAPAGSVLEVAWNGRVALQTDPLLGFIPDRSPRLPAAVSH